MIFILFILYKINDYHNKKMKLTVRIQFRQKTPQTIHIIFCRYDIFDLG